MANIKARIEKLEKRQPDSVRLMSDEQLEAEIADMKNDPEFQAWIADESDDDPLRLEFIDTMKQCDGMTR